VLLKTRKAKVPICRRKFKSGKDVRSKPERLEAVVCENGWPDGILGIGRFWHDPEALVGVVDESDDLTFGRCDRPRASEEVECRVVVEAALKMKVQVEIEQGWSRHGLSLEHFGSWALPSALYVNDPRQSTESIMANFGSSECALS